MGRLGSQWVQNLHPARTTLRSRVSVIDRFEEELVARLRKLRPLAVEYHQLEQVARRLGLAVDDERTTPSPKRVSRKTAPTRRMPATAMHSKLAGNASARSAQTSAMNARQRPGRSSTSTDEGGAGTQLQSRRQQ